MLIEKSCSFCHAVNRIPLGQRVLCEGCGHRADLPRLECDCERCSAGRRTARPILSIRCERGRVEIVCPEAPAGREYDEAEAIRRIVLHDELVAACEELLGRLEREGAGAMATWNAIDSARETLRKAKGE